MRHRSIAGVLAALSVIGGCTAAAVKPTTKKAAPAVVPAKPQAITMVQPARYVLLESVGAVIDEAAEVSPLQLRTPVIVNGKRLLVEGGVLTETAHFPETLTGFRSLPPRLGGGFIVWSDEHTYHTPTFLGKLNPIAKIGARGGVRPWLDSFVLRTNIGALEVNPKAFTVRRTELARFSEMISFDGQVGVRTDSLGRMEVSVDAGKTFRTLDPAELANYTGPVRGPGDKLVFRREGNDADAWRTGPELRIFDQSGKLVPFVPKTNENLVLPPLSLTPDREETAPTTLLASSEMRLAVVAGALGPGERAIYVQELNVRVLSAKTGQLIHNIPLNLSVPDFGNCQAIPIGDDIFLACTHPTGAHLFSLRGSPTNIQLEATFPEPGEFVAGLGQRFLFSGRCGSNPPTVRDFRGYTPPDNVSAPTEADPNPGAPDLPTEPEDPDKKLVDDVSVCIRMTDGTWIERRIEGFSDRTKARFLPGDNGSVTVVHFDKQAADSPSRKPSEGVRFIRVDSQATKFGINELFTPTDGGERPLHLVARNLWLDEKDGSVHGWTVAPAKAKKSGEKDEGKDGEKDEEKDEENSESEETDDGPAEAAEVDQADIEWSKQAKLVGVQINPDGTIVKHSLPEGADLVVVGGPYALARDDHYLGQQYFESTDGGRTYTPVVGPVADKLVEGIGGEVEGCSILGCALRGGLLRLGWGSATKPETASRTDLSKSEDLEALTSKVFDPAKLLPSKPHQQLVCRLNAKESESEAATKDSLPVTLAMLRNLELSAPVDRKWSTPASIPFELKAAHRVSFEDVKMNEVQGTPIPILRSTASSPVGLLLRSDEFRFDLSPGATRKPIALSSDVRGDSAAEVDRDSFVLFDPRAGEMQLLKGSVVRPLLRIVQTPDVYYSSFVLARRAGAGSDGLGVLLWQSGSGDMSLAELDLGRAMLGPMRFVGNFEERVLSTSCPSSDRDYRAVLSEHISVHFEPMDEERSGLRAMSLVRVGPKGICVEASEVHLVDETTLIVRYSGSDTEGHPAMLHKRGKSLPATCKYE